MPKIYSIVVIKKQPAIAFFKSEAFFIRQEILERPKKDNPPAKLIDQCVRPRHIISISPYPIAPIENIVKSHFALFKTITQNIFG